MILFLAGRKLKLMHETKIDGGLSQHVYGGTFGEKEMPDVMMIKVRSNTIQKIKLNFILLFCFWCIKIYLRMQKQA